MTSTHEMINCQNQRKYRSKSAGWEHRVSLWRTLLEEDAYFGIEDMKAQECLDVMSDCVSEADALNSTFTMPCGFHSPLFYQETEDVSSGETEISSDSIDLYNRYRATPPPPPDPIILPQCIGLSRQSDGFPNTILPRMDSDIQTRCSGRHQAGRQRASYIMSC